MKIKKYINIIFIIIISVYFLVTIGLITNLQKEIENIQAFTGYKTVTEKTIENNKNKDEAINIINSKKDKILEKFSTRTELFSQINDNEYYLLFYHQDDKYSAKSIIELKDFDNIYYYNVNELERNELYTSEAEKKEEYTKENFEFNFFPLLLKVEGNNIKAIYGYNEINNFINKKE